jgi:hypothetical protein
MQDAAWAIGLFGGIPAALIFLSWWIRNGTDEAANRGLRIFVALPRPEAADAAFVLSSTTV